MSTSIETTIPPEVIQAAKTHRERNPPEPDEVDFLFTVTSDQHGVYAFVQDCSDATTFLASPMFECGLRHRETGEFWKAELHELLGVVRLSDKKWRVYQLKKVEKKYG